MKIFTLLAAAALASAMSLSAADYSLPFSFAASQENLEKCTVLDENNDKTKDPSGDPKAVWFYADYPTDAFKYTYSDVNPADDWLILPAVDFGTAKKVKVSFQIRTESDEEDFEVKLGHSATAAAMTVPVLAKSAFTQTSYGELSAEIDVPEDGNTEWHLGFHVTSPAYKYCVYVKDIKITVAGSEETQIVPAAPGIAESAFADGTFTASVGVPDADTKGNALSGSVELRMLMDDTQVDSKSGEPGESLNFSYAISAVGEHTASFVAVLNGVESAPVSTKFTIEAPVIIPAAPVLVGSTLDGLAYSATVKMPSLDTEGNALSGYLRLLCKVDGTTVDTKTALEAGEETTFEYNLSAGQHTVSFQAKLGDELSEEISDAVTATEPSFPLPYEMTASADAFKQLVVIDVANDGYSSGNGCWTYTQGAFVYQYSTYNAADDWMILPMVDLGTSRRVKVSVSVKTKDGGMGYPESFEVKLGDARTVAGMTIPVLKEEDVIYDGYTVLSAKVNIPADMSAVCLGFHATSQADQNRIYVNSIKIEDADFPEIIPAAPVIKDSKMEYRSYTATIGMPTVDASDNPLTANMSLEILVDDELVETKADCAPGADVPVALSLTAGDHTIGFRLVLGENTGETVSENVTATEITTGQLPYTFTVTEESFAECETFDVADDAEENSYTGAIMGVWSYDSSYGSIKYTYHSKNDADDWVMLPLVNFGDATKVQVSFDVRTGSGAESFEVFLGHERTIEAMTIKVMEQSAFKYNSDFKTLTASVDLPAAEARDASNEYSLGIHASSAADLYYIYVKNFRIEALALQTSGIDAVEAEDADAPVEYFNLQGIRVDNPAHGIFIKRQGNKTSKVKF